MTQDHHHHGSFLPPEWGPHECVWVSPPHNPDTWPGCLDEAQQQFARVMEHLQKYVRVRTTDSVRIKTDDSWIRDYGPLFVVNQDADLRCHSFSFNCWGGKYESFSNDDAVAGLIGRYLRIPVRSHEMVLEGGAIDVNGAGTVMTTEQCLLNPNRNPGLTREQIEQKLHRVLGTRHVIWLPGGVSTDDTDGHIDDVARFIAPDTVAVVRSTPGPTDDPDHPMHEANFKALQNARDQDGQPLNIVELPAPDPVYYDFPQDSDFPGQRLRLPASYANFLITNQLVLVPIFGRNQDDIALRALERAMPDRNIIGVRIEHLVVGLGGIHCLTMQQPKSSRDESIAFDNDAPET